VSISAETPATSPKYPIDQLIDATRNEGSDKGKVFHYSLKRGDYFFVGLNNGVKGKDPLEVGTRPLIYGQVRATTKAQEWNLDVTIWEKKGDKGETGWRVKLFLRCTDGKDIDVERFDGTWQEWPLRQVDVASVPMNESDLSKASGVDDIQLVEIPYGKADGETHSAVVGIADDSSKLERAIAIPTTRFMFKWANPVKYPLGGQN
jgi:hypothetical protein